MDDLLRRLQQYHGEGQEGLLGRYDTNAVNTLEGSVFDEGLALRGKQPQGQEDYWNQANYDESLLGLTRPPSTETSARAIVDDGTVRSALYGAVEPLRSHNIAESGPEKWLDPRNLSAGIFDYVGKSLSKTEDPSLGDAAMASLDIASLGSGKLVSQFVKNLRNYVPGFYGGNPALGAARNTAVGMLDTTQDFVRSLYRDVSISSGTRKVVTQELAHYRELRELGESSGFTDEIVKGMRESARKIHGQLGQNIVHGRMMGKAPEKLKPWADKNFGEEIPFDRELAQEMFDDVDAQLIYDMSRDAWGGVSGGLVGKAPTQALFINKKNTRVAGNSFNDIVSSRQFKTLRRLNAKHSPKSAKEWLDVLDEYDPNWSKNLAIPRKSVVQGTDGVLFQFSPAGKQDYLLGGFNAILKVNKNGTAKMFGTDKQDIFNFKIPGGADAIIGIGNQKAVNFSGKELVKKLRSQKTPKYTPPKESKPVTIKTAKESQKKQKERKGFNYLSKEDESRVDILLSSVGDVSPARIGATAAIGGGLLGL
jgi:hypothetical protein